MYWKRKVHFLQRRWKRKRKIEEIFVWGSIRKRRKIPGWWREVESVMSFQKLYGLYNWKYDIAELSVDVTIAGQTRKDRATQPMTMEGWDEQWGNVESESFSISSFSLHFLPFPHSLSIFSSFSHLLSIFSQRWLQGCNKLCYHIHNIRASAIKVTPCGIGGVLGSCTIHSQHWCLSICKTYVFF